MPFGYTIDIEHVSMGPSGLWMAGEKGGLIQIRSKDPFIERVDSLGHEMQHALIDWRHWVNQEILDPLRLEIEQSKEGDE